MTASKGNTSVKKNRKSELYVVRYGHLFKHLDYLSRRGNKRRKLRILNVKSGEILPLW